MSKDVITNFPVTVYGNLEKYSDTISKGRCRIFYKYGNRNGTYITDEFADKLLSTISYAPVKGIFDDVGDDFTDHGESRTEGRIYGIVPENPNLAWEKHLDEDGVERTYACVDVLLFTALYSEANIIVGKSQSMELYPKSIKGDWQIIDGRRYYVFEEGSFLGLQALGDETEPCFEGAAFFSLYKDLKKMVEQIEKYSLNSKHGGKTMKLNYKLSDNAKHDAIWTLLNVNYTEEANWQIDCDVCEVYDSYAVVRNYTDNCWERVYYTKNDENDSVEITNRERCYIMDVSENEKNTLDALSALNNGTYEKIDENYSAAISAKEESEAKIGELNTKVEELNATVEDLNAKNSEFESKIEELNGSLSTLSTERDSISAQLEEKEGALNTLTEENATLNSFKADVEKKEKEAVIGKYTAKLDKETIDAFTAKIDDYSAVDLDKELAYTLVTSNPAVFSANPQPAMIPKNNPVVGGLEAILNKYKKN